MNLTAITDFDDVCKLHFVDSISCVPFVDFNDKEYCFLFKRGGSPLFEEQILLLFQ